MTSRVDDPFETSSKSLTGVDTQRIRRRSPESRAFGKGIFESRHSTSSRNREGSTISWQLICSGISVAVSSFLVFLLGVNIVIQYRTMVLEDRAGLIRKSFYLIFSVLAIYAIVQFNVWLLAKLRPSSVRRSRDSINYERLSSVEANIELDSLN